jgi:hypothetical protein
VEIVTVVARHDGTIGIRFMLAKSLQVLRVPWRNNTCSSVETAEPASPYRAGAIRRTFPGAALTNSGDTILECTPRMRHRKGGQFF